jgi:hypothetical protein
VRKCRNANHHELNQSYTFLKTDSVAVLLVTAQACQRTIIANKTDSTHVIFIAEKYEYDNYLSISERTKSIVCSYETIAQR